MSILSPNPSYHIRVHIGFRVWTAVGSRSKQSRGNPAFCGGRARSQLWSWRICRLRCVRSVLSSYCCVAGYAAVPGVRASLSHGGVRCIKRTRPCTCPFGVSVGDCHRGKFYNISKEAWLSQLPSNVPPGVASHPT
jgi:hypothetical protein